MFWLKPFGLHLFVDGGLKSAPIDQPIPRWNKIKFADLFRVTINLNFKPLTSLLNLPHLNFSYQKGMIIFVVHKSVKHEIFY